MTHPTADIDAGHRTDRASCPACGSTALEVFYEQRGIPAHSCLLLASREEAAAYPTGDLRLAVCQTCGFCTNVAFDPSLSHYSSSYEETQGFSPRFTAFARALAQGWIDRYDIHDRDILEIGCGKGEFLATMAELGGNRGIGIDPAVAPQRLSPEVLPRLRFFPELYGPQHFELPADIVVCRHTLEHIPDVADFVQLIRRGAVDRPGVTVLWEVPDTLRVLDEVAFWDLYYEHTSYFTPGSLARLFRRSGFDILDLRLEFDDQYIVMEARLAGDSATPPSPIEDDLARTLASVEAFRIGYQRDIERRAAQLRAFRQDGKRIVIWGAGSKGVAYLVALGDVGGIDVAVDVNPFKQGMYLAGTGKRTVAPADLLEIQPDVVIAMNPIYLGEIRASLDALDVNAQLIPA